MSKVRIQTKSFISESELNKFLLTLNITRGANMNPQYPQLHNIVYISKPIASGTTDEFNIEGSLIAIVEYFVDAEEDEYMQNIKK